MDFVLALHSHLPYVLNHGRWPHGSDWLCEAALDSYLPLLEQLQELAAPPHGTRAPVTIGFTPVLANQLASPAFAQELEAFFDQREAVCREAPAALAATGDGALLPLVDYWKARLSRLRKLFQAVDRDIVAAFRRLQDDGHLEIIGSAATHGYLPLLARDESVQLQLTVGRREHRRLFGRDPVGCWLPECAYRPRAGKRRAIEDHLAAAGFRYFFTDAHLARAGTPLGMYSEIPLGAERFDAERHEAASKPAAAAVRSPYQAYRVTPPRAKRSVATLVRDPRSSMQVWSRHQGYPGDEWYLEFHKIRWPDGLRLWRVTGPQVDLGAKRQYDPQAAQVSARSHADHFASVLRETAATRARGKARDGVVTAPFDAELFGHWWFEGVDFLANVYRRLATNGVQPVTAREHIASHGRRAPALQLTAGSWGKDGDFSYWLNDQTAWTWKRLWALEDAYWAVAPKALAGGPKPRAVLAQATRSLLLAQGSDWQFIIATGEAADYADQRFDEHCGQAEDLVRALASGKVDDATMSRVEALGAQDSIFPDVLRSIAETLA